jgi:hypothetical protein
MPFPTFPVFPARASRTSSLVSLLLFKLSWVLLVVWQDSLLLAALLLQGICLWLHPAAPRFLLARVLPLALTGIALDQLLVSCGVFLFPAGHLPGWLLLLWLAFGLVLTQGLRILQELRWWNQSLLGGLGGPLSYAAGQQFGAVDFGLTLPATLLLLALCWALLLPLQLRLARGWRSPPLALLSMAVLATSMLVLPGKAGASSETLQLVGRASFRYLLWQVYEARLYAHSSTFSFPDSRPFVLELQYQRNFSSAQILGETLQQWQQQAVEVPSHWPEQLASLLPDVVAGDTLSLQVANDQRATLSHNGRALGQIDDPAFSLSFAGIWLAENTTQPELRRRLLGASP